MTEQEVLSRIQQFIITNGNNQITADVLRPILEDILGQPNSLIGSLTNLNTPANIDTLVGAINYVYGQIGENGVVVREGMADPNIKPPAEFAIGDFYTRLENGVVIAFYVYNGNAWYLLQTPDSREMQGIRKISGNYIVVDEDYTIIFTGNTAVSWTLPDISISKGRILRLVNPTTISVSLNTSYITLTGATSNVASANAVTLLHCTGAEWYKIN